MDLSIIEAIYILFMLRFFKTKINFNDLFKYKIDNLTDYFNHPLNSSKYESKICKFGQDSSLLIFIYLTLRFILREYKNLYYPKISKIIALIILLFSLVNLNALIYLLPFFIYEFIFY